MLCAKRKFTGEIVEAYFSNKAQAPFLCPECGDVVILKSGRKRANYFAHTNPLACKFGAKESEAHENCKKQIFEALKQHPAASSVALERSLGTNRPDVCAYINGVPVAIEVQISSLSLDTIMRRTVDYARKGIYVLWLLLWTPKLNSNRYSPKLWEKWTHAAYFGHVYYWIKGLTVVSYHFDPNQKTVPKKSWFSEEGKKMAGGGYSRRSKRYRTPIRGRTFNLATDFAPREREWWEGGGIEVPDAKLFMHRHKHNSNPFLSDSSGSTICSRLNTNWPKVLKEVLD